MELWFGVVGRWFTLTDLKQAIVRASGGTLNGFYALSREMKVWQVIEAIEIVSEVNAEASSSKQAIDEDWLMDRAT